MWNERAASILSPFFTPLHLSHKTEPQRRDIVHPWAPATEGTLHPTFMRRPAHGPCKPLAALLPQADLIAAWQDGLVAM